MFDSNFGAICQWRTIKSVQELLLVFWAQGVSQIIIVIIELSIEIIKLKY